MQKPAKTLLWIAMGIEVVYAIAALIGMVIGSAFIRLEPRMVLYMQ